jgi:hypothetical protein
MTWNEDGSFGTARFRLLIDDVPFAPTTFPLQVLALHNDVDLALLARVAVGQHLRLGDIERRCGVVALDVEDHRLVQIHAFPNGNGRHGRIAADLYLADRFGHAPIDWAAGHNLQHSSQRRDAYISALKAGDAGDYRPLLAFVGLASADFAASQGR